MKLLLRQSIAIASNASHVPYYADTSDTRVSALNRCSK